MDLVARAMALTAAIVLLAHRNQRQAVLVGVCLGALAGQRLHAELDRCLRFPRAEQTTAFELTERPREGSARARLFAPDGSWSNASISGLGDSMGEGARGRAVLRFTTPRALRNPDDVDRLRRGLARRSVLRARVRGEVEWLRCQRPTARSLLRERLLYPLEKRLGERAMPLWQALVVGEGVALDDGARTRLQRLGLAHLTALSGLHVGLVVLALVGRGGLRPRPRVGVAVGVVLLWVWCAGMSPSLVRAASILVWSAVARTLGRASRTENALAIAALGELCLRPHALTGVGWWLSYAATLAILRVAPWCARCRRRAFAALTVSAAAQAATAPWALSVFGRLPLASGVLLLVLGPLFSVLLGLGLLAVGVGLAAPGLASPLVVLSALAAHAFGFVLRLCEFTERWTVGHPAIHGGSWAVALGLAAVWLLPTPKAPRRRLAISIAVLFAVHLPTLADHDERWWSFDVGQGDAGAYRVGDDLLVVDTGPGGGPWEPARRVLVPYFERRRIRRVQLVLTHAHADHTAGAPVLLAHPRTEGLWMARCDSQTAWAQGLADIAREYGVSVGWLARGDTLRVGKRNVVCLWPPGQIDLAQTNDHSVVLRFGPAGQELLATGDLERGAERRLLGAGDDLRARVLKVGHHGGNTGTDERWLRRIAPGWTILSCGENNRHGHPHAAVVGRLEASGAKIFRTDRGGAVGLRWEGGGLRVHPVGPP